MLKRRGSLLKYSEGRNLLGRETYRPKENRVVTSVKSNRDTQSPIDCFPSFIAIALSLVPCLGGLDPDPVFHYFFLSRLIHPATSMLALIHPSMHVPSGCLPINHTASTLSGYLYSPFLSPSFSVIYLKDSTLTPLKAKSILIPTSSLSLCLPSQVLGLPSRISYKVVTAKAPIVSIKLDGMSCVELLQVMLAIWSA